MSVKSQGAGVRRAINGGHICLVRVAFDRVCRLVGLGECTSNVARCALAEKWMVLQLSDCYGRMWVLSFNVGGLMLSDMTFLTVAHYWETLPGTYWWFALGPIIEGAVGGRSTHNSDSE